MSLFLLTSFRILFAGYDGGVAAAGKRSHEAFERLLEMEMRANGKQFHPSIAEHVPGMYGAELDMNLRYM